MRPRPQEPLTSKGAKRYWSTSESWTFGLSSSVQTFEFSAESRTRLENIGPSGLVLGMSTLRATRLENAAQQDAAEQPLSVELAIARGSWNRNVGVTLRGGRQCAWRRCARTNRTRATRA
jgi:hypothetical protein